MRRMDGGFTVAECLMAMVVLAASILGLSEALARARMNAALAADRAQALHIANRVYGEQFMVAPATSTSGHEDQFTWHVEHLSPEAGQPGQQFLVRVSWETAGSQQEIALRSYRWRE